MIGSFLWTFVFFCLCVGLCQEICQYIQQIPELRPFHQSRKYISCMYYHLKLNNYNGVSSHLPVMVASP